MSCQSFQFHGPVRLNVYTVQKLLYGNATFLFVPLGKCIFYNPRNQILKMLSFSVVVLCPQFSYWFAFLLIVTGVVKAKVLLVLRRTIWCHLVLVLRKDFIHRLTLLSLPPRSGHWNLCFPHIQCPAHLSWYYCDGFIFRNNDRAV